MRGDAKKLKGYTGEAVYNKLSHDILQRKKEGVVFDDNVLGIEHCDIHACQVRTYAERSELVTQYLFVFLQ